MSSEEFPTLQESTHTALGASWAEVAQSEVTNQEGHKRPLEQGASYADIAGHEKKLSEEYPSLEESVPESEPTSSGVSELINQEGVVEDPSQPPNPDKSFADATSNKGYPLPESTSESKQSDLPPLSKLPDVKDMLNEPSVSIPEPPKSFASIASKEVPPELRPLSERTQNILKQQEKEDPFAVNDENFPTLGQSNMMAAKRATEDERGVYTEISRMSQAADASTEEDEDEDIVIVKERQKSFADITASNMDKAPPSAESRVNQHPVYDEETVLLEKGKREKRKERPVEYGNNKELIEQEDIEENKQVKSRSMNSEAVPEDALEARLQVFDKTHSGKITIFDTLFALYRLGYPIITIVPAAFLMHIRLSALSSPYSFPFVYRSLYDIIALPIYTKNLGYALTYQTPMLHQPKEEVIKMVKQYGHKQGLGYWDGIRALGKFEHLRWWQVGHWAIHRIQWTLTYSMLYDPSAHLVTTPTLISLNKAC